MEIIQYQGTSFESIARGVLGMIILLLIAYLISSNRKQIKWKTVLMALSLQVITAVGVMKINLVKRIFEIIGNFFIRILEFTEAGTSMVLGDLNIGEPNALIGFAGPRVVKETIGKDLPEGFQTAEFVKEHGFLDLIVDRKNMKEKLSQLIRIYAS